MTTVVNGADDGYVAVTGLRRDALAGPRRDVAGAGPGSADLESLRGCDRLRRVPGALGVLHRDRRRVGSPGGGGASRGARRRGVLVVNGAWCGRGRGPGLALLPGIRRGKRRRPPVRGLAIAGGTRGLPGRGAGGRRVAVRVVPALIEQATQIQGE